MHLSYCLPDPVIYYIIIYINKKISYSAWCITHYVKCFSVLLTSCLHHHLFLTSRWFKLLYVLRYCIYIEQTADLVCPTQYSQVVWSHDLLNTLWLVATHLCNAAERGHCTRGNFIWSPFLEHYWLIVAYSLPYLWGIFF